MVHRERPRTRPKGRPKGAPKGAPKGGAKGAPEGRPKGGRKSATRGKAGRNRIQPPRIRWEKLRPAYDFWGKEIKRFYQLETLANATEKRILSFDPFIVPSIQEVLGPSPITALTFELFQEGALQLIFRVRAANAKGKRGTFGFVAAKNAEELSAVAKKEHGNLLMLHERAPKHVVRPLKGGSLYLPDRHRRKDQGREVYAYVTQWLHGFHELGIARDHQFFVNIGTPQRFSRVHTGLIQQRIIEVIVRTYDAQRRNCMAMPEIASGDFVVTKPKAGPPQVKLVACRNLLNRMTPAKLVDAILEVHWDWAGRDFRLAPADPRGLVEALSGALGAGEARAWLAGYRRSVSSKKLPERNALPLADLDALGIGL